MSLKTRLRLAVALLMSAMVFVLSGLYIQSFLETAFARTHEMADSLGNGLRASIGDELQQVAAAANPRPATPEEYREFWQRTVETDPAIARILGRVMSHWRVLSEIFITDESGRIRKSSMPDRTGQPWGAAPNLTEWTHRSLVDNLRQVYLSRQDAELGFPMASEGEKKLFEIHVVVSSVVMRNELRRGLKTVLYMCVACLVVSLVLALVLPTFVLSPLERLSQSIDLMATGKFEASPQPQREAKEFAAVYSKLNLLGQQYVGAQENADQLRGNVEQLLERLEEAVLLFDASGRLTIAGRAVRRLVGQEPLELIGRQIDEIFPPSSDICSLIAEALRDGQNLRDRVVSVQSADREYSMLVSVQPLIRAPLGQRIGALVTLRDAETRGELEAQLDMASRLTALSQLTRGVAHEIKNPLNAITLHLEVLRSRLEEEMPEVGVIAREISRLDRVVKTFLDFNRPVQPHLRPIDLNELARDVAGLVTPEAQSRNIRVDLRTPARPGMMNGDRDLLKQAILNVVMNGVEAMKAGGDLTIETRRCGGRIELMVSDTGPGIPPEVQDKIFNLYFSTKEHGSGIGLAMAFRFVQLHDGRIDFSSEAGRGTTFRFSFPEAASPIQSDLQLSRGQRASS
jgi:PAS domain S-box-containing protein